MAQHTPGPWAVGYAAFEVVAPRASDKGQMKVCDIRGWGYLTGKGHGALGLPAEEARAIQQANAGLIAAAPDLLAELRNLRERFHSACIANGSDPEFVAMTTPGADAAISKAEGGGK